jgi:16S rRNA G527 N7-methylase RsmG
MSTRIEVEYDRENTDADVQAIIARSTATINVMQQLGVPFQNLPGYAMAAYQTETDALEAVVAQLNGLITQIRPLLIQVDALSSPLNVKNKGALKTLSGLLQTDAQHALLAQITGPTAQGGGGTPPPPPAP